MLVFLRPAFAFAGVAAVVVGAVIAFQHSGLGGRQAPALGAPRVAPPSEVIASAAPIVPGSGSQMSVFGITGNQSSKGGSASGGESGIRNQESSATGARPPVIRRVRRTGKPINPASGVFDQWGESVFSDEEYLKSGREGKNVFNS